MIAPGGPGREPDSEATHGPLDVTPQTKVGELLDAYPQLEPLLIRQAPEFARLQNPILRKTVGKLATLAQAASIGGLDAVTLVNELRRAAGMEPLGGCEVKPAGADAGAAAAPPAWFDESRVASRIDAESFLARGEHPLGEIKRQAAALAPSDILALTSPFLPTPLIEVLRQDGWDCWTRQAGPGQFVTYFVRR